jgi:hypothetical protein
MRAAALVADDLKRATLMCGSLCTDAPDCAAPDPELAPDPRNDPELDPYADEDEELDPFDLPDSPDVKGDLDYHEWREMNG